MFTDATTAFTSLAALSLDQLKDAPPRSLKVRLILECIGIEPRAHGRGWGLAGGRDQALGQGPLCNLYVVEGLGGVG